MGNSWLNDGMIGPSKWRNTRGTCRGHGLPVLRLLRVMIEYREWSSQPNRILHVLHVWYVYLPTFTLMFVVVNVGNYTIHGSYMGTSFSIQTHLHQF